MTKRILAVIFTAQCCICMSQISLFLEDSLQILQSFYQQEDAWNRGHIDDFMSAYWQSDDLVFVGADGPHYGWEAVRDNYYRRYPDRQQMGRLTFSSIALTAVDISTVQQIGTYHLSREGIGDLRGVFTLIWKKFDDTWLITSDHTTADLYEVNLAKRLSQILEENLDADAPGGALLVAQGDRILFAEGRGLADMDSKEKISRHTVFNTGSISKTFVANAILILQERNQLSIKDPLTKYFDFEHPEIVQDITIEHLLSHTSGIPDLRRVGDRPEFFLTAKDWDNFSPLLQTIKLNFPPGSRFQYSNPAYNGLALIVEKLANMPWQHFVEKEIFSPAQMTTSKITNGPEPSKNVAHGYQRESSSWVENDYGEFPTFCAAGNGGIWSSVIELFHYERALQNGTFLPRPIIDRSRRPFTPEAWSSPTPAHVGHGWWMGEEALFSESIYKTPVVFHTGSQGGFRGYHLYFSQDDILITALFNRPIGREFMRQVTDAVMEEIR